MIDVYLDPPQPQRVRTEWHPAMTSQMCELIGGGKSFAQVGEEIGFSRNACIGRFNRLIGEADSRGLSKEILARLLEEKTDDRLDDVAALAGVSIGAVEARFAEIRRGLGPQAR